ncbi:MAG: ImmA/IrrE family metallo-endopeptidase [Paludibacter sp.]
MRGGDRTVGRQKFTLAHELGHLLLDNGRYMEGEYCDESDIDLDPNVEFGVRDIARLEWQANFLASCLLLPKNKFVNDFLSIAESLGLEDRGFGFLYLDNQRCNIDNYYHVTNRLKNIYQVSRSVVKSRLKNLRLLTEFAVMGGRRAVWSDTNKLGR